MLLHEFLVDNLEKLSAIFNTLREIIFTVDMEKGMIENVNNSIENHGYTKADWEGQYFKDWDFSKRKRFFTILQHASKSTIKPTSKEILFPSKDDSRLIPFEFSSTLFVVKNKKYLLCIMRDVSERDGLLNELKLALAKEKQLNDLRAKFISMASHQFRTPLTIIQSGVEIMEMYLEGLPDEKRKPFQRQFNRILGEINSLQELMQSVLTIGRSDAGRTPFKPSYQDIVAFCEHLVEAKYNSRLPDYRQVILQVTGRQQKVLFDEKLLFFAFENLLSNAYKYSKEENIIMQIDFGDDTVTINVIDKGIGIPAKDINNLFEPFYRSANTDEIEGSGLGLSIVKGFIDIHNGKIFVKSELNKGTTITVLLPLTH